MSERTEGWQRNLIALFIAQTMVMVAFYFVFPFFPLYIQTLGVEGVDAAAQWAGVIGASAAVSMAIAQPFWGNLADRYGRKPMVVRSMLGASLVTLLMGLVTSPAQLLVVRLIQGGISGTVAAGNALVATSTPRARLGFALGLMQVAMFTGTSIGPLIGGVLADRYGFRVAFYAASFLLLMGGLFVLVFVRENFTRPEQTTRRPSAVTESRALLKLTIFPLLVSVVFMIQFGAVIVTPILTLFVASLKGGEDAATASGLVLAGTGAVSAISALVIGRISDRVGHKVILSICLVGAALLYFPQSMVQEVWQLLGLRMAMGIFIGGLMPSANAMLAGLVSHERRGAAFGLAATASAMANFAGPLSGAVITTFWGMGAVFLVTGVLFSMASAWAILGLSRYRPSQAAAQAQRPAEQGTVAGDELTAPGRVPAGHMASEAERPSGNGRVRD